MGLFGPTQKQIDRFAKTGTGSPAVARAYARQQKEIARAKRALAKERRKVRKQIRDNKKNLPQWGVPEQNPNLPKWLGR